MLKVTCVIAALLFLSLPVFSQALKQVSKPKKHIVEFADADNHIIMSCTKDLNADGLPIVSDCKLSKGVSVADLTNLFLKSMDNQFQTDIDSCLQELKNLQQTAPPSDKSNTKFRLR